MPARRQRRGQNDAAISISLNGYKPKPITEWSGPVATSPSERFLFDVTNKTNIKYDGTTENISKSLLELPLGKALTADDLSKIPSQWTIDSQAYTINSWATVSTVLTVGTVIDPQDKIDRYNGEGYDPFEVYAQMTWPITIKFVTNVDGKTLQDINLTGATKLNGYSAATTNTMTEAQKKQVADVNTWVQQQENTDGFGRIFRGWYANSSFTGDPFRDGTGYSISRNADGSRRKQRVAREHAIQQLYDALCKVGRPLQGYIQHGQRESFKRSVFYGLLCSSQ